MKEVQRGESLSLEKMFQYSCLMVCFSSYSWHEVNQRGLFLTSFSDVKTSSKVCVDAESVPDVCLQLLGFRQE